MKQESPPTISQVAVQRIRELRQRRGLTGAQLAARCRELGAEHITRNLVVNVESGRRGPDTLTVDELVIFARALGVAPLHLSIPLDDDALVRVGPGGVFQGPGGPGGVAPAFEVRAWWCGEYPLGAQDGGREYYAERPDSVWQPFVKRALGVEPSPPAEDS